MARELLEMRDDVDRALASAEPELFRMVSAARTARPATTARPRVVFHPDDVDEELDGLTPAPGTVTLYWARRDSDILQQLAGANATGDFSHVADRFSDIAKRHARRRTSDVKTAVHSMLEAPSFFDLRYGKRLLAANLWIDESLEVASMVLPFAGGDLDAGGFEIDEYPHPDGSVSCPWDVLVVVRAPRLSELERRVLKAVPIDQQEILIAPSQAMVVTPAALVTIVVFVTINTAVTTCCGRFRDRLAEVSLPPDVIRTAAGLSSVTQLLQQRAEIFTEFGVR